MGRALSGIGKDQQILAAAQPLFGRQGFRKTTIDEIARVAGMGKGTIYLYFKSKEEIFLALARREVDAFYERVDELMRAQTSVVERMRIFVHERLQIVFRLRDTTGTTVEAFFDAKLAIEQMPFKQELAKREDDYIRALVLAGVADETFEIRDLEIVVASLRAALSGLEELLCRKEEEAPLGESVDTILDLFVCGLAGQKRGCQHASA